jgi:hypothetical protein
MVATPKVKLGLVILRDLWSAAREVTGAAVRWGGGVHLDYGWPATGRNGGAKL